MAEPLRIRCEAIKLSEQETGERKGHYLNVTANTPEEMYERAEFAKELGMPIIMHDFITGGFLPTVCRGGAARTACCTSTAPCTR